MVVLEFVWVWEGFFLGGLGLMGAFNFKWVFITTY